jgi:hypothetical protein
VRLSPPTHLWESGVYSAIGDGCGTVNGSECVVADCGQWLSFVAAVGTSVMQPGCVQRHRRAPDQPPSRAISKASTRWSVLPPEGCRCVWCRSELTAGTQSRTLTRVADENEYLQDLLVAGLHNIRPPIIESQPTSPATTPGTSPMDQLTRRLVVAVNQNDESDDAKALSVD